MPSNLNKENENQCDSDDWTLVSPAESDNSSTSSRELEIIQSPGTSLLQPVKSPSIRSRKENLSKVKHKPLSSNKKEGKEESEEAKQTSEDEQESQASCSQDADDEEDDGLVEVDLNVDSDDVRSSPALPNERSIISPQPRQKKSTTKSVEFAPQQMIMNQHHQQATTSSISAAIGTIMAKTCDRSTNTQKSSITNHHHLTTTETNAKTNVAPCTTDWVDLYHLRNRRKRTNTLSLIVGSLGISCAIILIQVGLMDYYLKNNSIANTSDPFNLLHVHPGDTAYSHLLHLDQDIAACIAESGYGWLSKDGKLTDKPPENSDRINRQSSSSHKTQSRRRTAKPFKGMVCYEREQEWRERIDKLKEEFNIDLRDNLRITQKKFMRSSLQLIHPSLRYEFILNQLEYLEYLDEYRRSKELERLKAENFELRQKLAASREQPSIRGPVSNPNGSIRTSKNNHDGHQARALARLENENVQLLSENKALKASLVEKAGTIYIKQSLELEKCERENNAFRQFHQQIAQEISRVLKELDVNAIDASALLNDHEGFNYQLTLTRGYMLRLGGEVSKLIDEKKNLRDEANHFKTLSETLRSNEQQTKQIEHNPEENTSLIHEVFCRINPDGCARAQLDLSRMYMVSADTGAEQYVEGESRTDNEDNATSTAMTRGDTEDQLVTLALDEDWDAQVAGQPAEQPSFLESKSRLEKKQDTSQGYWQTRRAKLRERLRKSSGLDILEKQIDRLIDESKHLYKKSDPKGNYYNYHKHNHQHKEHSHKFNPRKIDTRYHRQESSNKAHESRYQNQHYESTKKANKKSWKELGRHIQDTVMKKLQEAYVNIRDEL